MGRYIGTATLYEYLFNTANAVLPTGQVLSGPQQDLLNLVINDAESAIDTYCHRTFVGTAGTAYYSRYYQYRVVNQALYLDQDLHTLSYVQNGNGQVIPLGSVWTEPRNVGPPYRIVRFMAAYVWAWNTNADAIIAGTWGYSTVAPADVQQATLRYSAWLYRQKDIAGVPEVSGFPEAGQSPFPRGIPDDVRYLLSPYRVRSGGVI